MLLTFSLKFFTALTLLISMSLFLSTPAHALGLSPPTLEIDSLLRGTTQTRSVRLYRAPEDVGDVYIHVEPNAADAEFFVLEQTDIVMYTGQNEIEYEFGITPADASNGTYELKLRFLKTNDPSSSFALNAVRVVTGVTAQVFVTVGGEELLAYSLLSMYAQPTEEGIDTSIVYAVSNTGNVDWRPQKIEFAFFDVSGERVGEHTIQDDEIQPIRAGQENQSFTVQIPIELERGSHTVVATFYDADEVVGTLQTEQPFEVYAPGTLAQSGTLKGLSVNKNEFAPGEKVKLTATFQNDGEIGLTAVLITEITRDGEILDLLRSKEYSVAAGEEFVFSELIETGELGTYTVSSYVEYGKKQTSAEQVSFVVLKEAAALSFGGEWAFSTLNSIIGLFGVAVFAVLLVVLFLAFKRRKKKKEEPTPIPQEIPPSVVQENPVQKSQVEALSAEIDHTDSSNQNST